METSPATVIQYFNGEKQNLIPLFQRPYQWMKNSWEGLWNDLMTQYQTDGVGNHFMGAIVSAPAVSTPIGVNKYLIIDGQQRLTTISILLCALRDHFASQDDDESRVRAKRIHGVYLINEHQNNDDFLKFVPTHVDREIYKTIAVNVNGEINDENRNHLMVGCYRFFRKQIGNEAIDPVRLLITLEQKLQVVMINLSNEDDPYLIFEGLNFKGSPLTQADLVRNYILMRFQHSVAPGGKQETIYQNYWNPLEESLEDNLTDFLRHYAMLKNRVNIPQGGIYAAIKNQISSMNGIDLIENEIKDIFKYGKHYEKILCISNNFDDFLVTKLKNIKTQTTTHCPLLLKLFELYSNDKLKLMT